jgi:hypothetical protein
MFCCRTEKPGTFTALLESYRAILIAEKSEKQKGLDQELPDIVTSKDDDDDEQGWSKI